MRGMRGMRGWGLLVLFAVGLTGCGDTHNLFPNEQKASDNGQQLYYQARGQWAEIRAKDMHGPPLRKAMDDVMAHLDGAIVTDPKCPLFLGKRGEMMIELGPDSYDRAVSDLNQTLTLEENWIPARLALADLATRRNDLAAAENHLQNAESALTVIQTYQKAAPIVFYILGLNIRLDKPPDPKDPRQPEEQRYAMLMNRLQDSEQWTVENAALLARTGTGRGITVDTSNLVRRFTARIQFQRLIMSIARGDKPAQYMPLFDKVFDWDPNLFPARIEQAHRYRVLGQYREAERILRPYMDSPDPKIAGNARLLYEMAAIYTDWYINAPESEHAGDLAQLAEKYFAKLHEVNEEHAEGWIKRAELYARGAAMKKNKAGLDDARRLLDNARKILQLKQDTPEIKQAQAMIDNAQNELK